MYNETIKYLKNNYLLMKEDFNNNLFIKEYIIFCDRIKGAVYQKLCLYYKKINNDNKIFD